MHYDLAIAILDAWATVAYILTFYQERIANEGFLRTATERMSILELAGTQVMNRILSSNHNTFLALDLEQNTSGNLLKKQIIHIGMKAQKFILGPESMPQIL